MIDTELVTRKILLIARDVEALQGLAVMTPEAFLGASSNAVLAERYIERAAGRNRIAHEYDEIDPQRLFEAVRQAVHDVPEYLRSLDAWPSRSAGGRPSRGLTRRHTCPS
jgi:hypothetical protein